MLRTQFFLVVLLLFGTSKAQTNLVPNPSFENYSSCTQFVSSASGWVNCGETPNYCNSCSNPSPFGVSSNFIGYQPAATGNAYCILCTYSSTQLFREIIGISLTQALTIGNTYFVSFKCSPGSPGYGYCLQTDKIGLRFSTVTYDSINSPSINNFAHIYAINVVTDTANWTTVSGYVTADSAYTFLAIGNFFDDANTDTIIPGFQCAAFALYYVDDVVVSDSITGLETITPFNDQLIAFQIGNDLVFQSSSIKLNSITLYDYVGNKVGVKSVIQGSDTKFNVEMLCSGVYLAVAEMGDQRTVIKCIIIKL